MSDVTSPACTVLSAAQVADRVDLGGRSWHREVAANRAPGPVGVRDGVRVWSVADVDRWAAGGWDRWERPPVVWASGAVWRRWAEHHGVWTGSDTPRGEVVRLCVWAGVLRRGADGVLVRWGG